MTKDEMKATLFSIAFLTDWALCLGNGRVDLLVVTCTIFAVILIASAKIEKVEKRLKRYKDDAVRRGREQMSAEDEDEKAPTIIMTRGKAS